ncbi:MAG: hypothetical protein AABX07_05530 [Nanoarchaeota archaeon]
MTNLIDDLVADLNNSVGQAFSIDKNLLASIRERNDALKAQSKPLEELIVAVPGSIISPSEQTVYGHKITPHSEIVMGGRSPEYGAGQSITTKFRMVDKREIEGASYTRTSYPKLDIIFEGPTALEFEYSVKVYLFLGENREYENLGHIIPFSSGDIPFALIDDAPSVWVPRAIEKAEKALRIIKYNSNDKAVAVYTDAEYVRKLGLDVSKIPLI